MRGGDENASVWPTIARMVEAGQRPEIFGGAIVAALDWEIAECWPRFVLPATDDPNSFRLDFCQGLDVLVLCRSGHDAAHVHRARAAIAAAGANVVAPVELALGDA